MKIIEIDIAKLYYDSVIKSMEEYTEKLRRLVANTSFIDRLLHIDYTMELEQAEKELYNCYIKLAEIIEEEIEFNKRMLELKKAI